MQRKVQPLAGLPLCDPILGYSGTHQDPLGDSWRTDGRSQHGVVCPSTRGEGAVRDSPQLNYGIGRVSGERSTLGRPNPLTITPHFNGDPRTHQRVFSLSHKDHYRFQSICASIRLMQSRGACVFTPRASACSFSADDCPPLIFVADISAP